jgi:hypothetical protein
MINKVSIKIFTYTDELSKKYNIFNKQILIIIIKQTII